MIEAAQRDINHAAETLAAGVCFEFMVRSDETSPQAAMAAVVDLVENEHLQIIVGLPLGNTLIETVPIDYLSRHQLAVISSASTAPTPISRQPDNVFLLAPTELYWPTLWATWRCSWVAARQSSSTAVKLTGGAAPMPLK